jgi:hypothetical protein
MALFQFVNRLEKSLNHKEIALGAFLDIEGAFDNTSFQAIVEGAGEHGIERTCCRWIGSMLDSRLVHMSVMGSGLTVKVVVSHGKRPSRTQHVDFWEPG